MTDVWKSIGKHFCEICKVWMTNNKLTRDHHDKGLKHQAMIKQRIHESQKKARDRDRELMDHQSIIAQMEAAAVATMVKHGEDLYHGPSLPSSSVSNIFDPRQHRGVAAMASELSRRERGEPTPINTASFSLPSNSGGSSYSGGGSGDGGATGKGQPLPKPRSLPGQETFAELSGGPVRQLPTTMAGQDEEVVWVQAYCTKGKSYYWNIYTKEKRTTAPGNYLTPEEYFKRQQLLEMAGLPTTGVSLAPGHMNRAAKRAAAKATTAKPPSLAKLKKPRIYEDTQQIKIEGASQTSDLQRHSNEKSELPLGELNESTNKVETTSTEHVVDGKDEDSETSTKPSAFGSWVRVKKQDKKEEFLSPLTAKYREIEEKEEAAQKEMQEKEPIIIFEEKTADVSTKKAKTIEFRKKGGAPKNMRKREEDD